MEEFFQTDSKLYPKFCTDIPKVAKKRIKIQQAMAITLGPRRIIKTEHSKINAREKSIYCRKKFQSTFLGQGTEISCSLLSQTIRQR